MLKIGYEVSKHKTTLTIGYEFSKMHVKTYTSGNPLGLVNQPITDNNQ